MTDYQYNCYKLCGNTDVTYTFIKDIVLDPVNIKEHLPKIDDNICEYGYRLFNQDEDEIYENYRKFREMIKKCKFDYFFIMYKIILPLTFEWADDFAMTEDVIDWLKKDDDDKILNFYGFSICYEMCDKYKDYIYDIFNDTTARRIALSKLKRNKIVNEGILLKISMMRCGLF